jgi:hypothetical protein
MNEERYIARLELALAKSNPWIKGMLEWECIHCGGIYRSRTKRVVSGGMLIRNCLESMNSCRIIADTKKCTLFE